jgi:hypothetical protein
MDGWELKTVGVGSAKLQMVSRTGLVIRTKLKEGKVKFSQVLSIEKDLNSAQQAKSLLAWSRPTAHQKKLVP